MLGIFLSIANMLTFPNIKSDVSLSYQNGSYIKIGVFVCSFRIVPTPYPGMTCQTDFRRSIARTPLALSYVSRDSTRNSSTIPRCPEWRTARMTSVPEVVYVYRPS